MFNDMFLENLEFILTSEGNIVEYPGTNRTSSYVKASEIIFFLRGPFTYIVRYEPIKF